MQASQCAGAACAAFLLLTAVCSLWTFWRSHECEMSWMYPKYVFELQSGRYVLYNHNETYIPGGKLKPPDGYVPALFLPGNAGSYEQVRSLGAAAMRDFRRRQPPAARDLVWYVADFQGELSAFSGQALTSQTKFAAECLVHLHEKYAVGPNRKMILVGHSMGGIIARAAVQLCVKEGRFSSDSIALILTLATPHQHPPFMTQPAMAQFYANLSPRKEGVSKSLIVPIVSIDGSPRDWQVPPILVQLHGVSWPGSPHFTESMSKLLGVWVGADHQCIVWCNQLIVGLATGLITVVNRESKRSFNSEENTQSEQNSLSYATGVIDSIKTGLGAVSEADLKPGSYVNFLQDGPICEGPLPEIVASEDFLLGPDVLEIDSSIFQSEDHKSRGIAWSWNWPDVQDKPHITLLVGAEKPCIGFRMWVTINETYIHEVTGLLSSLPPASEAAKVVPLKYNEEEKLDVVKEIVRGRDYFAGATWWLSIGKDQLRHANRLILWISPTAKHPSFFAQGTVLMPKATPSPPNHILGIRNFFIAEEIPVEFKSFQRHGENLKQSGRGVEIPLKVGVLDYVTTYFHIELKARMNKCKLGSYRRWDPIVVDPDHRQVRNEYSVYHVLASPECSLSVWINLPIGNVLAEYVVVKIGELLALCMCVYVWKLLRLNGGFLGTRSSRSRKEAKILGLYDFLMHKFGFIGLFWLFMVCFVSLGAQGNSGLLGRWPVRALGMWMQPFETRYPSIYRIWDSFLAIGLTQFFQSMLDATNNLCCIVVSSTACAWKSMGAYLGFKNAAEPVNSREEDEYSDLGLKTKGILVCLGILHPGIASAIAAAVMGQVWRSPGSTALHSQNPELFQHYLAELEQQKERIRANAFLSFYGFLLWLPSLIAWLKSGSFFSSWTLSEAALGVPCLLFVVKGVPRPRNLWYEGVIMGLWQLSFMLALVFILDGYSSTGVYLHFISTLFSVALDGSKSSGTHKRE